MSEQNKTSKSSYNNYDCLSIILIAFIILVVLAILCCYIYTSNAVISSGEFKVSESFVGTMTTIIGILVTFVIGYQIYNAVESNRRINSLESNLNQKVELINNLESEFKNSNIEFLINNYLITAKITNQNKNEFECLVFAYGNKLKLPQKQIHIVTNGNFTYRTDIPLQSFQDKLYHFTASLLNSGDNYESVYIMSLKMITDILNNDMILKEFPKFKDDECINTIKKTIMEIESIFNTNKEDKNSKITNIINSYNKGLELFQLVNKDTIHYL